MSPAPHIERVSRQTRDGLQGIASDLGMSANDIYHFAKTSKCKKGYELTLTDTERIALLNANDHLALRILDHRRNTNPHSWV